MLQLINQLCRLGISGTMIILLVSVMSGFGFALAETLPEPSGYQFEITKEEINDTISEVDSSLLDDAIKLQLQKTLSTASEVIVEATAFRAQAQGFREAISTVPEKVGQLEAELGALPSATEAAELPRATDLGSLRKELEVRRASLSDFIMNFNIAEDEYSRIKARPLEAGTRLSEIRTSLAGVEGALATVSGAQTTIKKRGEKILLMARRESLKAELELLKQERLSQVSRERLKQTERDLALRKRNIAQAVQSTLGKQLNEMLTNEVQTVGESIEELVSRVETESPRIADFIKEINGLWEEFRDTAQQLEKTGNELDGLARNLGVLNRRFVSAQHQISLGAYDESLAQTLLAQRRTLPNPRIFSYSISERQKQLAQIRLASLRLEEAWRKHENLVSDLGDHPNPSVAELLKERQELIERLRKNYRSLAQKLTILDADERAYRSQIIKFRDYLVKELFWRRSSPVIDGSFIGSLPDGIAWVFNPIYSRNGLNALASVPRRHPWLSAMVLLCLTLLTGNRRKLVRIVKDAGQQAHRVSTDRYSLTLKALACTHLISLPIPLLLSFLGWGVFRDPEGTDWVRGLGKGLLWTAIIVAAVSFLRNACRRGGLCQIHFGWSESSVQTFSSFLLRLFIVQIPTMMLLATTLYENSSQPFNGIGRFAFILSNLWMSFLFFRYFHPSRGVFSNKLQKSPDCLMSRTRYLWYPLLVIVPIGFILLAGLGYLVTAISLSFSLLMSFGITISGVLLYSLILRWFMIKERRMALEERIRLRSARKEMAEDLEEGKTSEEIVRDEEAAMNLDAIGNQTRRLLQMLISIGVVLLIWFQWTAALPMGTPLDKASVAEGLSFMDLAKILLILAIGGAIIRNLPGLIELAGLRDSSMDTGTRYAVVTIAQYAASVIVALVVFRILDLEWSQFSWIAAALSVGLGFGLQEVVANFVCGIVLLFERPIRVGDVVVVNQVSGTVTRIRMRATTITNWDHEELVVPNKEFITGSLINCTLSNTVNRVLVPVGVAYGSDVVRALKILGEIAKDHPAVIDDPAPVTSFEEFADSTLSLKLRCYLPNRENRLGVITDIHCEIDRRFKEEGIEIAFPQHDLHLRSVEQSAFSSLRDANPL